MEKEDVLSFEHSCFIGLGGFYSMIAYLIESVLVSSDVNKLVTSMKETGDKFYDIFKGSFNSASYSLILPDGKPGVWFRKKVKGVVGEESDILVYCYSMEGVRHRIRIRIQFNGDSETFPVGGSVLDIEHKNEDMEDFKKTVKLLKIVRDMIKRVSHENRFPRILAILDAFSKKTIEEAY